MHIHMAVDKIVFECISIKIYLNIYDNGASIAPTSTILSHVQVSIQI